MPRKGHRMSAATKAKISASLKARHAHAAGFSSKSHSMVATSHKNSAKAHRRKAASQRKMGAINEKQHGASFAAFNHEQAAKSERTAAKQDALAQLHKHAAKRTAGGHKAHHGLGSGKSAKAKPAGTHAASAKAAGGKPTTFKQLPEASRMNILAGARQASLNSAKAHGNFHPKTDAKTRTSADLAWSAFHDSKRTLRGDDQLVERTRKKNYGASTTKIGSGAKAVKHHAPIVSKVNPKPKAASSGGSSHSKLSDAQKAAKAARAKARRAKK